MQASERMILNRTPRPRNYGDPVGKLSALGTYSMVYGES